MEYIDDQNFKGIDFTNEKLELANYEDCQFSNCNFASLNLSKFSFENCEFIDCDLSMINVTYAAFKEVTFRNCKALGIKFETCNPFLFKIDFQNCQLNFSSFFGLPMKHFLFKGSEIRECDFAEADLSCAKFIDCNLDASNFDRTNLTKADFSTAVNFTIDPDGNHIDDAQFSKEGLLGLLTKYKIKVID